MNKKFFRFLFFVFLLLVFTINVNVFAEEIDDKNISNEEIVEDDKEEQENYYYSNSKYKLVIEDDANLLSSDEKLMLEEKMKSLLEYGNIAFKSINKNLTRSASSYASNYYHDKFQKESGSLFLIDMDTRKMWISTTGEAIRVYSDARIDSILDSTYNYIKSQKYYLCANAFVSRASSYASLGVI